MKTLRAYIRKSIIDGDTDSPARQQAVIKQWNAGRYHLEWYEDLDISGRFEANRPGWQRLLADLGQPDDIGVIVESYDRSHRNVKQFLGFYDDLLEPRDLTLISATQNIDLATNQGRMIASILMSVAEGEARETSDRMRRHIRYLIDVTGRHFGPIPFGCERHPDTHHLIPATTAYILNPATGQARPGNELSAGWELRYFFDTLRACYDLHATGQNSYQDTADLLNAGGFRFWERDRLTPVRVHRQQVRKMTGLWELYAGRLPTAPAAEGGHAPILPPELCQRIGAVLQQRTRGAPGNRGRGRYIYLLTGRVRCGKCGQPLIGQNNPKSSPPRSYRHAYGKAGCSEKSGDADQLEQEIIARLAEPLQHRELLLEAARAIIDELSRPLDNSDINRLIQRRAAYGRLIDLHTEGLITKTEFIKRREALAAEIEQLEARTGASTVVPENLENMIIESMASLEYIYHAPREAKRELIQEMVEQIEIVDKKISRFIPAADIAFLFNWNVMSSRLHIPFYKLS